jgi:hypothetical protein
MGAAFDFHLVAFLQLFKERAVVIGYVDKRLFKVLAAYGIRLGNF